MSGIQSLVEPRPAWDQGDIVSSVYFAAFDTRLPGVLVTPACDIYQDKVDLWTFVALFPDVEVARQILNAEAQGWGASPGDDGRFNGLTSKQSQQLERKILELLHQKYQRYHWLPVPIGPVAAHVADFSCVCSLPAAEIRENAARIASLASSWREQVPSRYAAFMARVGTHEYEAGVLDAHQKRMTAALLGPVA